MNLVKKIAFACVLTLFGCESPQNVEGNTFVSYHGEGYGNDEAMRLSEDANSLLEQGRTGAARKLLLQSLELERNKITYNSLGVADQLDSSYASAIVNYQQALAIDSGYVDARLNLARTYSESGNTQMAIQLNLEVIAKESDTFMVGVAHMHVAKIYVQIDSCNAAIRHNDAAHKFLDGNPRAAEQMERNDRVIEGYCNTQQSIIKRILQEHSVRTP